MKTDNKTMIHLKVSKDVRDEARKVADAMGVSLSLVGEQLLRGFVTDRRLSLTTEYEPNSNLESVLKEAEKNRENPDYWDSFDSVDNLMKDLNS